MKLTLPNGSELTEINEAKEAKKWIYFKNEKPLEAAICFVARRIPWAANSVVEIVRIDFRTKVFESSELIAWQPYNYGDEIPKWEGE
jgi:hypothetical protein